MKQSEENVCAAASQCGACSGRTGDYVRQLQKKEAGVRALLGKYGKVLPILGMEEPAHYRCKVHAVFGSSRARGGNYQVISGTYRRGTHRVVKVDSCLLDDQRADRIIYTIRQLMPSFKLQPYDEDRGAGLLRHVLIRTGYYTGQIMVALVTAGPLFPSRRNFVKALLDRHPEITTIAQNINGARTSMVLGKRNITLYGKGFITDRIGEKIFAISPNAFYQVNPRQTQILYKTAIDMAGLTGREKILDAYCGVGTIGICAADHAGSVLGIELNTDAVRDARGNAKRNGAENVSFICADAAKYLREHKTDRYDVIFMDPPRSGSAKEFIHIAAKAAARIVYVSCNPQTLARDLELFRKEGWKAEKIQPVDMFPFTQHTEVVVLLQRTS